MISDSIEYWRQVRHERRMMDNAIKYSALDYGTKCRKCLGCQQLELDDFYGVNECKNFKSYRPVKVEQI